MTIEISIDQQTALNFIREQLQWESPYIGVGHQNINFTTGSVAGRSKFTQDVMVRKYYNKLSDKAKEEIQRICFKEFIKLDIETAVEANLALEEK